MEYLSSPHWELFPLGTHNVDEKGTDMLLRIRPYGMR